MDVATLVVKNTEKNVFSLFNPTYIAKYCKLPAPQDFMIDKWIKDLDMDVLDCAKKMMLSGKQFLHKDSGEYETANLRTPYHLITLMLNQIFSQENGNFYKIRWIPIICHVAMKGIIFN